MEGESQILMSCELHMGSDFLSLFFYLLQTHTRYIKKN